MALYQRADSPWWWYHIEGTKIRKSTGVPHTGPTPKATDDLRHEAESVYLLARAEHLRGSTLPRKPRIGFSAFARWYDAHELEHQRSRDRARSMLGQLETFFGRISDLQEMTEPLVKEWMTWRRKQVAPSTVNRELDLLKAMMRAAVPTYLDHHPLVGMRRFRIPEAEPRVLTGEEEARLLEACGTQDKALVLTALDTLLRLSSVVFLQWPQVKLDQRVILPLNAKVSTGAKPISTRLFAALSDLKRTEGYVFSQFHQKGDGPTAARNLAIRRFDYLCRAANIPRGRAVGGLTFHCLRHTGATRALQNGASLRTVMELGGWKNERTVLRYLHATDLDVREAAELIGRSREPHVNGDGHAPTTEQPYGPHSDTSSGDGNSQAH